MKVGMRKRDFFGNTRMTVFGSVEHIEEKESFVEPGKKSLHIYFKGNEGKGIIALSPQEVERILHSVERRALMEGAQEEIPARTTQPKKKSKRKKKK